MQITSMCINSSCSSATDATEGLGLWPQKTSTTYSIVT